MTKEPIEETVLREIPRRKRKIASEFSKTNISYKSLLPIPSTLHMILEEWLQVRNTCGDDILFCNIYGEPLQRTVLQSLVKRYSLKCGVQKYGLHLYRHTFITLSIRNGCARILY